MNAARTAAVVGSGGLVAVYEKWKGAGARKVAAYRQGKEYALWVVPVSDTEYLERKAAEQLLQLLQAASAAGHPLTVTSGFRFMKEQEALYQRYLNGTGNLAARPGFSNHQQGISVDLGGVGGFGTAAYQWLKENGPKYGFENDVRGEHWHWTYMPGKAQQQEGA